MKLEAAKEKAAQAWGDPAAGGPAVDTSIADRFADILKHECDQREGLIEMAWAIIANAGEGNWHKEHPDWRVAAERWHDEFHKLLKT